MCSDAVFIYPRKKGRMASEGRRSIVVVFGALFELCFWWWWSSSSSSLVHSRKNNISKEREKAKGIIVNQDYLATCVDPICKSFPLDKLPCLYPSDSALVDYPNILIPSTQHFVPSDFSSINVGYLSFCQRLFPPREDAFVFAPVPTGNGTVRTHVRKNFSVRLGLAPHAGESSRVESESEEKREKRQGEKEREKEINRTFIIRNHSYACRIVTRNRLEKEIFPSIALLFVWSSMKSRSPFFKRWRVRPCTHQVCRQFDQSPLRTTGEPYFSIQES